MVGMFSGLLYSCSLAVVKYNKPDSYMRRKVEPFLHGVPIAWALISSITFLAKQNLNDGDGMCVVPVNEPPHCVGYEDGETREGFDIPCGRGRDGAVIFTYLNVGGTAFLVPLTIGISLGMIRRSVSNQENNMASYGANNFTGGAQQPDRANSRLVRDRAIAYSVSYFLTWGFTMVVGWLLAANVGIPIPLEYLSSIFNPLQGVSRRV